MEVSPDSEQALERLKKEPLSEDEIPRETERLRG